MTRPCGIAAGSLAFAAAWAAGLMLALLTGAAAVVILLVGGAVGFVFAAIAGGLALRRVAIDGVATSDVSTSGENLAWHVSARTNGPVRVELRVCDEVVASGVIADGDNVVDGVAPRRGVHTEVEVHCTSGGRAGLVIWRRRVTLPITPLRVGPVLADRGAEVAVITSTVSSGSASDWRPGHDEPDGVRPWRDGDDAGSVHWPSSLRSSELISRQRLRDADERWIVLARTATGDPDAEAGRVRRSLMDGLAQRSRVGVRVDGGDAQWMDRPDDIVRWCAEFEADVQQQAPLPWWRRSIRLVVKDPEARLTNRARWLVAAASATPLAMMLQPLGYGATQIAIVLAAAAAAAAASRWTTGPRRILRQFVGLATAVSVAAALIDVSQITNIATSLRFLLPQVLVVLVVLQGFECSDRRAARVSLAGSAFLTAYAAGVRVDAQLGWWLVVAGVCWCCALLHVSRPSGTNTPRPPRSRRATARAAVDRAGWVLAVAAASLAILAVVPIPRGPAQLTLPSWLEQRRPTAGDGGLATPDGSPLVGGAGRGTRSADGAGATSAGSYAGFSPQMDTSLRGDLGDEVVLRVRAPYPDFWRGQTYSYFDGRTWTADDQRGFRTDGPDHLIRPAVGDVFENTDEFIQTFYPEVDLPNLIFAAPSARRVLLDASLWQRPDGAMRADVALPAGSAYTVVSARSTPTAALLRLDGDIASYGSPAEYIQLPASTTQRVRDLARDLAMSSPSTYDTIRSIEQWLRDHVAYDLDAPTPADGEDAVDDFLFESRRGFCEQIATATTVMLRSLGVPARVATGFVPSERDEIAGVWISRARDAHAWVEVRFPGFGWVAFDPTASVPLAGEADETTIGGELAAALKAWTATNIGTVIVAATALVVLLIFIATFRRWLVRRRRGRWGVLQDRFAAAAMRRGALPTDSNAGLAAAFDSSDADAVAQTLDASAFARAWVDDDELFEQTADAVRLLESVS